MSRLLLIALLLSVAFPASSRDYDNDGWHDDSVDEGRYRQRTYPIYRPQPYSPQPYGDPWAQPTPKPLDTIDARCDAQYQDYLRSLECFNRYRYSNGTMRPEAYQYCGTPILDPGPNCGPPRNWR
jgi:hypothetical protein